jgi:hypothetical protein
MIRILVAGLFLSAAACGGTPRNTALKNRVDEERLAPVSLANRSMEAEAHQGVFLAEWQIAFTKGQLEGAALEVKIAKNNLASAKIGKKSAVLEKKAADESGDINKIKAATQAALVADKEAEVHQISIDRAKQSLAYLKKRLVYEESQFRSQEAKLEYARASSLNTAGIVPPNFKLKTYKSQYSERKAQAKSNKAAVDAEHKELKSIDQSLAKAKAQVEASKNGGVKDAATPTGAALPELKPVPPVIKNTTPTDSTPGDTATPPETKPTESTPAPDPAPREMEKPPTVLTAPAEPKTEPNKDAAPTSGGQP